MKLARQILCKYSILESNWSSKVKSKWTPPKNLFASDDPSKIASVVGKSSKSYQQAVSRINFYYNRAGKNIPTRKRKSLAATIIKKLRSIFKVKPEE